MDPTNKLFHYDNKPLRDSIEEFAKFSIAANERQKEPRLLVTSIDVQEGEKETFDSYEKESDGLRKSEYGKYGKYGFENVTRYDGVTIEHIMASATVPQLYYY